MPNPARPLPLLCLLATTTLTPYGISPIAHSAETIKQKHHRWYDQILSPVHEKFALMACQRVARELQEAGETPGLEGFQAEPSAHHPLLRGVQWPDDPNNLLRTGKPLRWLFWMTDGKEKAQRRPIGRTYYLQYRSHFGDLQFLHGMASRGSDPALVQAALLGWARFAYDVATGRITPTTRLKSLEADYAFVRLFSGTSKMGWTVQRFFANVGDKPGDQVKGLTAKDTPWLAAGALLHTCHDSFCDSHTEREARGTDQGPAQGSIRCLLDYASQDSGCHKARDLEPAWTTRSEALAGGPVGEGTWLLRRILARAPWEGEVEAHFRERLFALSGGARPSDGGGYDHCD